MKMEAITLETRLLCHNHIDTAEQLCSYKGSLETEMSALLQKRKELYSKSRRISGEEKEAVKAELSDISGRLKIIRKEVRMCEGIAARSDTLKEKLQTIRADEKEQQRKELMKNEHRRRSGRTNRPNELGRVLSRCQNHRCRCEEHRYPVVFHSQRRKENQRQSKADKYAPFWQGAESLYRQK